MFNRVPRSITGMETKAPALVTKRSSGKFAHIEGIKLEARRRLNKASEEKV